MSQTYGVWVSGEGYPGWLCHGTEGDYFKGTLDEATERARDYRGMFAGVRYEVVPFDITDVEREFFGEPLSEPRSSSDCPKTLPSPSASDCPCDVPKCSNKHTTEPEPKNTREVDFSFTVDFDDEIVEMIAAQRAEAGEMLTLSRDICRSVVIQPCPVTHKQSWGVGQFLVRFTDGDDAIELGTERLSREYALNLADAIYAAVDALDDDGE